ncbi:MAG: metallophosphoesterase family protein [Alphaproteobacteria bacterium]|nr:metallophosphoesterase family protein [Alphaproteobacteria bacterium]
MTDKPTPPRLPKDQLLYVVGDIHGRVDLLVRLMKLIEADAAANKAASKELIFLGDYIDRGVDSKGVISYLLSRLPADMKKTFLRGNHDEALLRFLQGDLAQANDWLQLGGTATLVSYGINPFRANVVQNLKALHSAVLEKVPEDHRAFLTATKIDAARGGYYFVHAGVRPGVPLEKQTREDRLWIRYDFLGSKTDHGKMIVHGHSILPEPDVQPNRIGIDTGAYATGTLTCLVLHGSKQRFLST